MCVYLDSPKLSDCKLSKLVFNLRKLSRANAPLNVWCAALRSTHSVLPRFRLPVGLGGGRKVHTCFSLCAAQGLQPRLSFPSIGSGGPQPIEQNITAKLLLEGFGLMGSKQIGRTQQGRSNTASHTLPAPRWPLVAPRQRNIIPTYGHQALKSARGDAIKELGEGGGS